MEHNFAEWARCWESGDYVLFNPPRKGRTDDDIKSSFIYHVREHTTLLIENDEFAYALKKRMREAGVPVVTSVPPGKSFHEFSMEQLACLSPGTSAFLNAYNEVRTMKLSGKSDKVIECRIRELTQDVKNG